MISFPFTSESGDRKVYTKDFRQLFKSYFTNGVFNGGFAVTPATGMKVNVSSGWCNIEGCFGYSEETVEKTIETVSSETYFNIVLRLDDNKANRNIDLYVVKGTSSPAQLTRNDTVYELCIARIKVGASDTSITLDMIEDTRLNTELCGIVASAVQTLETDTYYNQLQGALDKFLGIVQDALDETLAGNLQKQITQNSSNIIDLQQNLNETDKYVNFKYSTDEQWTGKYWIDGKKIYKKTISFGLNDQLTQSYNHGLNLGDFRSIDFGASGLCTTGNKIEFLATSFYDNESYASVYSITDTQIQLKIGTGWTRFFKNGKAIITLNYTKAE